MRVRLLCRVIARSIPVALAVIFAACQPAKPPLPVNYSQELPPGELALRKISPDQYPDFSGTVAAFNLPRLTGAIDHSLAYLATPSSRHYFPYQDITHDRAVATLVALKQLINTEIQNPANDGGRRFDAAVRNHFEVYQSIGALDPNTNNYTGDVLFTAYYTPTFNASLTRTGPFQYPLYKRPADLVDPDGMHAHRQLPDGSSVPCFTRRQIELEHAMDGNELVWLPDRFAAYIITVQGSARLRLTDGSIFEVGYHGNNGYEYVSPGRQMVADGIITKEQLTLDGLKNYFAAHPGAMDTYLSINPHDVFFTQTTGGPFGSLGPPVTPFATIATDKSIFPRAMPVFLTTTLPSPDGRTTDFRGLMFDQDTGRGIRTAGRCDIYMGLSDQAGQELNVGKMYYLALKS